MYFTVLGKEYANAPPDRPPEVNRLELGSVLASIGAATSTWQMVEFGLYQIYEYLLAPSQKRVAAAIFYAVVAFQGRLNMVDAAMAERFPDNPLLEGWQKLSKKISRRSQKRNTMAHNVLYFEPAQKEGRRLYLAPPLSRPDKFNTRAFYKADKLNIDQAEKLHGKEIDEVWESFMELQGEIFRFLQNVPDPPFVREPPKPYYEPSDNRT